MVKTVDLTEEEKDTVEVKELDLPETVYASGIENRVFQTIILQCLSKIEGIGLIEGTFLSQLLGSSNVDGIKGIYAEQSSKNQSLKVKVEVTIAYGLSIPEKAEEIQTTISREISALTGLHVSAVHVVFKNVILEKQMKDTVIEEEYSDDDFDA